MKKITFFMIIVFSDYFVASGQMIIPEFDEPTIIESLSSDDEESMPLPFNDANGFYFYRTYYENAESNQVKGQDIWTAEKRKKGWESPYRLFRADFIQGNSTNIGTSEDGSRIYLLITKYMETRTERKIGYMDKTGKDKWGEFNEIKIEDFKFKEKYYHFYMTSGEEILLISMSPETNRLNEDLYVSLNKDGKWMKPIDLGKTINTPKVELSPFMGKDGTMLYFSSDGHGGLGESDIFVSRRLDDTWKNWTKPANLGAPINSDDFDDYFIIGNGNKVFFTSSRNAVNSNIYQANATGGFRYAFADSIIGQFIYEGLPAENVTIEIYDLEDNMLIELETDEEGKFIYKKLKPDQNFMVKIKTDDGESFIGSKIYFSDSSGKRYKRQIFTEVGMFVDESNIKKREEIQGKYTYNSLPMKNATLVLYDENGFPVDTIYTDEFGNFNYSKIAYDSNFTLLPIEEADDFSLIDLYLTDKEGNRKMTLVSRNDKYAFLTPSEIMSNPKSAVVNNENPKEDKLSVKVGSIKDQWNGMALEKKTIYFEFASNSLNTDSKRKLNRLITLLKQNPSIKLQVTGHTDAIESEEKNYQQGLGRAEAVKSYLVSKGEIQPSVISIESKGELKPVESNSTKYGRALNRRVEIKVK